MCAVYFMNDVSPVLTQDPVDILRFQNNLNLSGTIYYLELSTVCLVFTIQLATVHIDKGYGSKKHAKQCVYRVQTSR